MKKLDREAVPAPPCLSDYRHGEHTWEHIAHEKPQIQAHLERLQGKRCAYCEADLTHVRRHIDHFRPKGRGYPELTFAWSNLYWSCDEKDSCGHFKDRDAGRYDPDDLIEPCVHDPPRYLQFRADGTVEPRRGLLPADERRARETLRVFNLQRCARLRSMRRIMAMGYIGEVDELSVLTPEERSLYLQDELGRYADLPFSTLIRQMFEEGP